MVKNLMEIGLGQGSWNAECGIKEEVGRVGR
jgi:hypothetical protein